ncbi:MAG TPA: hypothetical protein VIH42_02795 [Thermoguttaceae bacterium]
MKKQPDFARLFREHFDTTPAKLMYQVRQDSNRMHDIVFLSSLIHDARFRRKDLVLRNKRLVIGVERDCWELGMVDRADSKDIYLVQSRLIVSPVTEIKWGFAHGTDFAPEDELWIHDIWIARQAIQPGEYISLILGGFTWECILTVHEPNMTVRLQDIDIPRKR